MNLVPTLIRNVPGVAFYFGTLQHLTYLSLVGHQRGLPILENFWDPRRQQLTMTGNIVMGATARTIAGFILMPATLLKVRYESSFYSIKYGSLPSAIGQIWHTEGVAGFFRGFGSTALRDAPHAGIYLLFYQNLKPVFSGLRQEIAHQYTEVKILDKVIMIDRMAAGLAAGLLATAITQPVDVVKTRIQVSGTTEGHRAEFRQYRSFIQAVTKIVREEGLASLLNGIVPRILRKSLSSAITWTIYEELSNV